MDDAILGIGALIGVRLEIMSQKITGFSDARNINSSLPPYFMETLLAEFPGGFRQLVLAKAGLCEVYLKFGLG